MNNIEKLAIKAKKIEWQHERDNWYDSDWGLHIYIDREEKPEKQYVAAWGEGDQENFATFEEAEDWCQNQIDAYVNRVAVVDAKALQQSSEPVAYAYPDNVDLKSYKDLDVTYLVCSKKRDDFTQPLFTHPPASVNPVQSSEPVAEMLVFDDAYSFVHLSNGRINEHMPNGVYKLFTHPPASVPLEKYNKLLDAVRKASAHVRPTCDELYQYLEQAIAEAEGKA